MNAIVLNGIVSEVFNTNYDGTVTNAAIRHKETNKKVIMKNAKVCFDYMTLGLPNSAEISIAKMRLAMAMAGWTMKGKNSALHKYPLCLKILFMGSSSSKRRDIRRKRLPYFSDVLDLDKPNAPDLAKYLYTHIMNDNEIEAGNNNRKKQVANAVRKHMRAVLLWRELRASKSDTYYIEWYVTLFIDKFNMYVR